MTIDLNYYFDTYNGTVLSNDDAGEKALKKAYKQINIICLNRLDNGTVDNYTDDIQNSVKNVICEQADFIVNNSDLMNTALKKYKINGVEIEFDTNDRIAKEHGIMIPNELVSELSMYGLTYKGF